VSHLRHHHEAEYITVKAAMDGKGAAQPGQLTLQTFTSLQLTEIFARMTTLVSVLDSRPLSWAESPAVKQLFSTMSRGQFTGLSHQAVSNKAKDLWLFEVRPVQHWFAVVWKYLYTGQARDTGGDWPLRQLVGDARHLDQSGWVRCRPPSVTLTSSESGGVPFCHRHWHHARCV
jgi:hypothetical protein